MDSYQTVISQLEDMRARYKSGFSSSDRDLLEELHYVYFHKPITLTGCSDCYRDAYIILFNRLKKEGKMPELSLYALKSGHVIHEFGSADYYTLDIPEKVAEDYLRKDPANIRYFARYPKNWKERIVAEKVPEMGQEQPNDADVAESTAPRETKPAKGKKTSK